MRTYKTLSDAYLGALADVLDNPEYICAPRGIPIREITNYSFKISEPTSGAIETKDLERNKVIASYTAKEKELYDSCSNRVEDFAKASKFWNQLANLDGSINSAYGFLIWRNRSLGNPGFEHKKPIMGSAGMRTPWEWCVEALKEDKDTRQAVLRFSLPEHHFLGNKDFVCTMHGNFHIREDRLNFSIVMRANDLVKGTSYDLPWFISLMEKMVEELRPIYPNLTMGTYTHLAHSLHLYEKDLEICSKMLGRGIETL